MPANQIGKTAERSTTKLRLLLIEDEEDDAFLLVREIRRSGFDVTHVRVCTRADLVTACSGEWDLAISDWSMPTISGLEAFQIVRESLPHLPFLIVSGELEEHAAVTAMRAGVDAVLVKGKLARLLPTIELSLRTHRATLLANRQLEETERLL